MGLAPLAQVGTMQPLFDTAQMEPNMNKILLLTLPALLLGACGGKPSEFTPTPGMTSEQIFAAGCQRCHGEKGQGKIMGVLKVAGTKASKEDILKALTEGGKAMPSFPKLSDEQKSDLADFVKGL